jgi:FkbM family methyltransferase
MDKAPALPWRDRLLAFWRRRGWRGYLTLIRYLKPPGGRAELCVATRYGSRFFVRPGDSVDSHVLLEGFYESEVLEAVRPALRAGSVLWVVGANFGLHAVTAKYLHPDCRVIAFEPLPAMSARLLEHCALNGVRVDLISTALGERPGILPFFVNASGNPGASTLHPTDAERFDYNILVAVERADALIEGAGLPGPTAMIVDAERAELEVFRGLGRHLAQPALTHVVFEAENEMLALSPPHPLAQLLRDAGFVLTRLQRNEHTAHGCSNFLATRTAA